MTSTSCTVDYAHINVSVPAGGQSYDGYVLQFRQANTSGPNQIGLTYYAFAIAPDQSQLGLLPVNTPRQVSIHNDPYGTTLLFNVGKPFGVSVTTATPGVSVRVSQTGSQAVRCGQFFDQDMAYYFGNAGALFRGMGASVCPCGAIPLKSTLHWPLWLWVLLGLAALLLLWWLLASMGKHDNTQVVVAPTAPVYPLY
ncbi:Hypothetical protein UVM_LOCUS449 [uncultured virus]|nr:Hypothetical protein UVM_LOCUS449 [uncultured virus]